MQISIKGTIFATKFNNSMKREDFPILNQKVHGRDLVYLDNAATTQKPKVVLQAITEAYKMMQNFGDENLEAQIELLKAEEELEKANEELQITSEELSDLLQTTYKEEEK